LGKRALFGVVARREEGNDASRWAMWVVAASRMERGCPGRAAQLDWGQAASAGPRWAAPEWGGREWLLGLAQLPAGFRPTASLVFKIPFLFSNLFIICKLI
jgi:hypothetical protein